MGLERPHTQTELGIGMLTLPTTKVCLTSPTSCTHGDISPEGHMLVLYRPNAAIAFGGAATLGLSSGTDQPQRTYAGLDRGHTRQYLLLDATARYYAVRFDAFEGWAGATLGGVVVNDAYTTNTENPSAPILGPKGVAIRTEAITAGIAAGIGWTFARDWSVEGMLRSGWWFLPSSKKCAPTGDCATLGGLTAMFSLGISISYRIRL